MRVIKQHLARPAGDGQSQLCGLEREQVLEQVLEHTGEAVVVKDLNAVVTYWNREATVLYGF